MPLIIHPIAKIESQQLTTHNTLVLLYTQFDLNVLPYWRVLNTIK